MGDYRTDRNGTLQVRISDLGGLDYEIPVLIHELIEWYLCQKRGISNDQIDVFDFQFQGDGEPGDSPLSPYIKEHRFAENIERQIVHEAGLRWAEYDRHIEAVTEEPT